MPVQRFSPADGLWPDYITHLLRVNMARWGVAADGSPLADTFYFGVVVESGVVGHLSLKRQPILVPPAPSGTSALVGADGRALEEMFVQTFAVEETHRRRGYGRALQAAALDFTRENNCYQLRSWSSFDHRANYALKISLGFGVHPTLYETPAGAKIGGVYFVKTV